MRMRCTLSLSRIGWLFALGLALAGCTKGGQFDPTTLLDNDMFDSKKPLQGQREPVFPNGVPGANAGIPADLYKGYQPPPEQAADNGDAALGAAPAAQEPAKPEPKAKPKAKPKPKVARAPRPSISVGLAKPPKPSKPPAQQQAQPAQTAWPNPTQSTGPPQTAWPNPTQSAGPPQTAWPNPQQAAPVQQAAQPAWPNPTGPAPTQQ